MASTRLRLKFLLLTRLQSRGLKMAAQLRAERAVEDMKQKNPYFEKYASKIAALQETSPEGFLERVEKLSETSKPKTDKSRNYTELLHPKEVLPESVPQKQEKLLSDVMKVELIQNKTAEEIKAIWLEYHKKKDVLAATIPIKQYEILMERGKQYPTFIFPLPRTEGYEFILLQFYANTVHFTPLLCYQVHKENAPECLNLIHYTEMKDKGIVLMRGEYDPQVLNSQEAQCLANQLQLYYCRGEETKIALLEKFNKQPDSFKHMDLVKELENIQIQ